MGSKKEASSPVRLVIQQCLSATLKLPEESGGGAHTIGRGMVVFVCFRQGATEEDAARAAETACALRLCEGDENGGRVSVADLPGDVLVIPQATLGGKLKGRAVQYHGNVGKEDGERLYRAFCAALSGRLLGENDSEGCASEETRRRSESAEAAATSDKRAAAAVRCGVYGARQVLSSDTNGPYTHHSRIRTLDLIIVLKLCVPILPLLLTMMIKYRLKVCQRIHLPAHRRQISC